MKINVPHVAKLANLSLSSKEIDKFEKQLSEVLDYVNKLEEVNVENTPETSQVTDLENVYREDEVKPSLPQDAVLSNAKATKNGQFAVKGIFDND